MKVAVIHNGNHEGVLRRFGRPCPERYSLRHIQMVADALGQNGHDVSTVEADVTLFEQLRQVFATENSVESSGVPPAHGEPVDAPNMMVFNMAYGIQGDARYTHLPAMLELAGFPYTGSDPLGHALALDKVITKILMRDAGVPTPAYQVLGRHLLPGASEERAAEPQASALRFPVVVKPRHESTSYGLRLVDGQHELDEAVGAIVHDYRQEALVEEYIDGREVCIGLLGNEKLEFLPPVELDFGDRSLRLVTWDDKYHKRLDEPQKVCPAPLEDDMVQRLNGMALATFRACHLRDYARVDIRIDPLGNPFALEVNSMASLGDGGSFVTAAKAAGYDMVTLTRRILEVATRRYAAAFVTSAETLSAAAT